MPFERRGTAQERIAVIGGGIAGMGAAHHLARQHAVVLFESEPRLGGHARTVFAGKRGDQPVDTGFIVFNTTNYPHLTKLFSDLGVPVTASNMSFGASVNGGRLEYGLASLDAIFAQRRNVLSPRFIGMIRDILKFNSKALDLSATPGMTIAGLLERLGTGIWFRDFYLLPLSGAIWSTPCEKILDFPAHAMVSFFENHALLRATGQHQWLTVDGGSVEYVRRLGAAMDREGVDIRTGAPVVGVRRTPLGVEVKSWGGEWEPFDEVVFATHSDDTLRVLADPSPEEIRLLGAIRYQPNTAVLHADSNLMPKRRACWASWVYTECEEHPTERISLTYWMNSLQPIPQNDPLFVTLNSTRPIREELVYDEVTFRHPVYDLSALHAQARLRETNGRNRTWFCGAWMKNGFHEDGLSSALDVVNGIAARLPKPVAAE